MNHEKAKHLVDKLLACPVGREVLGKELGGEIAPTTPQPTDLPVVACLVPCRDHPQPRMQEAFMKIQAASKGHCSLYLGSRMISTSVVHWSRNMLLSELIKTQGPWTHVLFIDDDIVPPDDALNKMLAHKKDIIGALCTTRMDPPKPNIKHFDNNSGLFEQIWSWEEGATIEVGAVGTGMMLITREALGAVAEAYWTCAYEREFYQMPEERAKWMEKQRREYFENSANAFWFRFLPALNGTYEMGEDMSFCFMARRYCNIPTFVDTSIQPEHIGQYGYSIKDFLPYRDEEIEKARREGRFKDETLNKPEGFKLDYEAELVSA